MGKGPYQQYGKQGQINRSKATAVDAVDGVTRRQIVTVKPIPTAKPYNRKMQSKEAKVQVVEKEHTNSREQMEQTTPTVIRRMNLQTLIT